MSKRTRATAFGVATLAAGLGAYPVLLPAPVPDLGRPARRGVEKAAR